jgi:FkbM family methyltransferase
MFKFRSFELFAIKSLIPPIPKIKIVDVGAMTHGDGTEPYQALLKAVHCEVIGFEPVGAEFQKLDQLKNSDRRYLPYFIGDGTEQTFHECNFPMTSSLFEPNSELLEKFQNLEELTRVIKKYPVQTTRLDDIPEIKGTDFLKVDVQGAELMVFQGAVEILKEVLVIQTEVEFAPMYKKQPLFSDIDKFLRSLGFQFHRLVDSRGRVFKPLSLNNQPAALMSQWLWGDAIYVRDFMAFDNVQPLALLKLAAILHENYRSFDLAAYALSAYDRLAKSKMQAAYIQKLLNPF